MKPDAIYVFEKCADTNTRYGLVSHRGGDIPRFPAVWKRPKSRAGKKYVGFRHHQDTRPRHGKGDYTIELENARMCTDFDLTPEYPRKGCGDFSNSAVLIAFSEDWARLTMLFFEDKKGEEQALFAKWVCGEIPESVEGAAAPLP